MALVKLFVGVPSFASARIHQQKARARALRAAAAGNFARESPEFTTLCVHS